jgi:AAA15 family ATPase/GTPase
MLVQFSVRNFRTFKDKATLNLLANHNKEIREDDNVSPDNPFSLRILKSAVVFGANASGKSKLLEALLFMKDFTIESSKDSQSGDVIDVDPFRLNTDSIADTSEFEVMFTHEGAMFRYGFEVDRNKVYSEWLFQRPKTKEIEIFYREGSEFTINARKFAKGNFGAKQGLVRTNALLLSLAAQLNDPIAMKVVQWFRDLKTLSGLREDGHQSYTVSQIRNPDRKSRILELLKAADLAVEDVDIIPLDIDKLPKNLPKELMEKIIDEHKKTKTEFISDIAVMHRQYDSNGKYVKNIAMSLDDDCSSGTAKFFSLTGPILDCLDNGFTLLVDELDSKLHPNLVSAIISLFNSKKYNPNNAQLIFNSLDTNLLGTDLFRKDQIWFTEKDRFGQARLFSLADFKSSIVRNGEAFEDNYLKGKYGAIPYLGYFDSLGKN